MINVLKTIKKDQRKEIMSKRTRQSITLETIERRLYLLNKRIDRLKSTLKRYRIEVEALERIKETYQPKEE